MAGFGDIKASGLARSVEDLAALLRGRRTVVLSGAGMSTESGIPDYRGPQGSLRSHKPMTWREFAQSAENRRRYWARSASGWERVRQARPNAGHFAVARMESLGSIAGVITQNVDRLHQAAGSRRVIELHGALAEVRCMGCGRMEPRDLLQERLRASNPGWSFDEAEASEAAPDGDAELPAEAVAGFSVPGCQACGGTLKPDVVFFGENVPAARVEAAMQMVDDAGLLLVTGSSLTVYSGYRFAQRAAARAILLAIVNVGPTRADPLARLRIEARLGDALPRLAAALEDRRPEADRRGPSPDGGPSPGGGPAGGNVI
jgi:NAD-dependent deacetylase sirtuin 4